MLSTSYQSPRFTLTSLLPLSRWMHPPHPAAGRLHLDALWWTALAETSEREIYLRACCVRSSRLPSLPQASRLYDLPPPHASTRSLLMPTEQGLSTPGSYASLLSHASQAEMTPTREPAAPTYFRPPSPFAAPTASRRRSFMR